MDKIRVYLADDHTVVREGLKSLLALNPKMQVIGEAGDGVAACSDAQTMRPDVVVMDLSLPGMNGAMATESLKESSPDTKVLALTVHEDKGYLRQMLHAGASGYVLKRAAADELVHAIETVAGGGIYIDPEMAGKVVHTYLGRTSARGRTGLSELSERETEVVRLIAKGYSNKEIAGLLKLSVKTVETYKSRSMEKLQLTNRADIVRYALRQGWLQDH